MLKMENTLKQMNLNAYQVAEISKHRKQLFQVALRYNFDYISMTNRF